MILVVGATGMLGLEICRRLRASGSGVRALVRPESGNAGALRDLGVEMSPGDLRHPDTVARACEGASAVISTATAMGATDRHLTLRDIDGLGQQTLVKLAVSSGVQHFVFISVPPHLRPTAPLVRYKRAVEAALQTSAMRWTILQPSVFMEVWLSSLLGWDVGAGVATVAGNGRGPMTWISVADVAEYAVRSLTESRLVNREMQLGGPERLSPADVVRIFEDVARRPFRIKRVPAGLLGLLAPAVALFNEGAASGMSLMAQSAPGETLDLTLQRELGLPLTTVRRYAERIVAGTIDARGK
ncbi:MAG: SDR family oxidoreductase [bacterium]